MKKNVILLVVDSMNYTQIKKYPQWMPFLNRLKEDGVSFENMYSQAPYTEAATMSIYCGQDVLNNGGYIRRFKDAPKTVFEAFREKGYTTYYNYFQPQCYPSSLRRGIDFPFYDVGFDLNALWSYRLYYYADLLKKNEMAEEDWKLLTDLLEDNLREWILFAEHIRKKDETVNLIQDNAQNYNAAQVLAEVSEEFRKFKENPEAYAEKLLTEGTGHRLFQIPAFRQDNKIKDKTFIRSFQEKYTPFFCELKSINRRYNRRNCKGVFKGSRRKLASLFLHPSKTALKEVAKSLLLAANVYNDRDLMDRIADDYEMFKYAPSIKSHIDHYINWETHRKADAPSFACIHVDDIHNAEMFFTYDSEDMNLIDSEFEDAKDVIAHLPEDYYGNITHDLSLRYMDGKIRYLYERLRENGLSENTVVLICADHGFSFSGNPLRDSFVINMYLENYNIPCIITGTKEKGKYEKLCASKDIPVLLSYLADGEVPSGFAGKNVLCGNEEYEHLFIEYCGGGCPDLKRRKLKIGCFNTEWFVASECELAVPVTEENVTEVYHLREDPLQLCNLKGKIAGNSEILLLIEAINQRKQEIKKQAAALHSERE